MKFIIYLLWTISAPFFAGGLVWVVASIFLPMWMIAIGMIIHTVIWAIVHDYLHENDWYY